MQVLLFWLSMCHVLQVLDCASRIQLLSVDVIWDHFSLQDHYCRQHGTKLDYWERYNHQQGHNGVEDLGNINNDGHNHLLQQRGAASS